MFLTHATNSEVVFTSQEDKGRYIAAVRGDGLQVFLDKSTDPISQWLNHVRERCDRKSVMIAVGMARGLQIAMSYAQKYGNEEEQSMIAEQVNALVSGTVEFIPTQIKQVTDKN
mgnify:CR=1 FL=1